MPPAYQQKVVDVEFTIGAEAANAITVSCQFIRAAGGEMTKAAALPFYLAEDSAGLTPETTAPAGGGIAAGTDGALIESVANLSGLGISEADGDLDVVITDTGTPTYHLVFVLPSGELAVSGAITFA